MKRYLVVLAVGLLLVSVAGLKASGTVRSKVIDNIAYVYHSDAYFNCCPTMKFEITQSGTKINIVEHDLAQKPCKCMCHFDFTHKLEGLEAGTYTAYVWEQVASAKPQLAGTTSFVISDKKLEYVTSSMMSECHNAIGKAPDQHAGLEFSALPTSQSSVSVRYHLPEAANVKLAIYNVAGSLVRTINQGSQAAGDHFLSWDLRNNKGTVVPRGVYIIRLFAGKQSRSLHTTVLR